jgi:hypothetical protein
MHIKYDLMIYPFASIQHEMALDAMLDEEANTRAQRSAARFDLKTRLKKQPLWLSESWPASGQKIGQSKMRCGGMSSSVMLYVK